MPLPRPRWDARRAGRWMAPSLACSIRRPTADHTDAAGPNDRRTSPDVALR